jgi:hypothetical protein
VLNRTGAVITAARGMRAARPGSGHYDSGGPQPFAGRGSLANYALTSDCSMDNDSSWNGYDVQGWCITQIEMSVDLLRSRRLAEGYSSGF